MAKKLTCDFCGIEIFDSTDPIRPLEQAKCVVTVYRAHLVDQSAMLDRDACASCADKVARILAQSDGNLLEHLLNLVVDVLAARRRELNRSTSL